jgi:hypothetical protein
MSAAAKGVKAPEGKAADGKAAGGPLDNDKAAAKKGGFGFKLAIIALCASGLAVLPLCLIALPGMMPSIAACFLDGRRTRYLGYTVGVMNFAGVFPFLLVTAQGGMTLEVAAAKLSDPFAWIVMYGAAAIGYLTAAATPPLARLCIEIQSGQRRRALEAMAKAMRSEWGDEVARGKR